MSLFNLNLNRYVVQLTPPFLRDKFALSLLLSFVKPLNETFASFTTSRRLNLIKFQFNYQVCSLEYRLNDAFDRQLRRIKIVKATQFDDLFLYTEAEDDANHSKTLWLKDDTAPIYLRTEAELYTEFDFIVKIPNTNINQYQLEAEIDFYKLPSKRYTIQLL